MHFLRPEVERLAIGWVRPFGIDVAKAELVVSVLPLHAITSGFPPPADPASFVIALMSRPSGEVATSAVVEITRLADR